MDSIQATILYFLLFVGIYYQVFVLVTYLVNRTKIKNDGRPCIDKAEWPSVTIVVPVWNEEKTVGKTLKSLLTINYPKDRLNLMIIDDGSTDSTWNAVQKYKDHPQIQMYQKENGGKHTAVNYAIARSTTDFIGCLDADSFVDKDTLKKMMVKFDDPATMAVTPALKIHNPSTIVQMVQSAEYIFGILVNKVMAMVGAIHVTPGPLSIFRRETFNKIGVFKKAHNTEDMEMAFRMHANHLKIENVHNAYVYTTGPSTFKKLYKQRLRWTYGFIQNARDYKYLFFNPKYGNVGLIKLPIGLALILGVVVSVFFLIYRIFDFIFRKYAEWRAVGFMRPHIEFNWFFISARAHIFLFVFIYILMFTLLFEAQLLTQEKVRISKSVIYYFVLFPIISPFWVVKSIYNAVFSKSTSWR